MGRELYFRSPDDPNYKTGIMEINDDIEMLLGQIKMMLFTNKGEVLGAPDFGANLEELLFTFNLNEYALKTLLHNQTLKFIPLADKYPITYNVSFSKGTIRDICLIDVFINDTKRFGMLVT